MIDTVGLADATVLNATGLPHADVEFNGDLAVHYRKPGENR